MEAVPSDGASLLAVGTSSTGQMMNHLLPVWRTEGELQGMEQLVCVEINHMLHVSGARKMDRCLAVLDSHRDHVTRTS